jgi:hypothetical protein
MQEWIFSFAAISMPAAEDEEEGKATETKTKKYQKKNDFHQVTIPSCTHIHELERQAFGSHEKVGRHIQVGSG